MNSALHQELLNPSRFNLYAAIALVSLIFICLIVGLLVLVKKPNKIKSEKIEFPEESGKGFQEND
tara:strand:+ start:175 stop:369 length:195 start_codon:yes stop_codon:yes gene_type:complete